MIPVEWSSGLKCSRDNGCFDVADTALVADEQISAHSPSHHFFHFYRFECGRRLDAGRRPTPFPWIFAGCSVLVDGTRVVADVVGRPGDFAGYVLHCGLGQLSSGSQNGSRKGDSARTVALPGIGKLILSGGGAGSGFPETPGGLA